MTTASGTLQPRIRPGIVQPWLLNPRWDLTFLILSVFVAALPYTTYILFGGAAFEAANVQGTAAYNARLLVNNLVTFLIGGPHMYATFTRTIFDREYLRKRRWFLATTILVPVTVVAMAVWSYESYVWLLSVFFAVASLHALYQILWLSDAYSLKAGEGTALRNRVIDYGVVVTSLYPIATYKMVRGEFKIGPVDLKYNAVVSGWYWLAAVAALAFGVMFALFVAKSYREYQSGHLNAPKTLLISLSVLLLFWTPAFPNLDTAFQGVNTWHSFQYLALVWYANLLRQRRLGRPLGFMHWPELTKDGSPGVGAGERLRQVGAAIGRKLHRIDRGSGWTIFYLACVAMLPISGLLMIGARLIWPGLHLGQPGADEAYSYIGVLSILLMHYVQDGLLFTDAKSLVQ